MSVTRYGHTWEGTGARTHQVFGKDVEGDYVEYKDYAILEQEVQILRELAIAEDTLRFGRGNISEKAFAEHVVKMRMMLEEFYKKNASET